MADTLSRADLVERLATVSHRTWMRQKVRGAGDPAEPLSDRVTDHDREQAEDTVRELEELEVYAQKRPSAFGAALRHPVVVGALLAVFTGVFASLLVPSLTRVWQDRPRELALKRELVARISREAQTAIDSASPGGGPRQGRVFHDRAMRRWRTESAIIGVELTTYFPASAVRREWLAYVGTVNVFLRTVAYGGERSLAGHPLVRDHFRRVRFDDPVDESMRKEVIRGAVREGESVLTVSVLLLDERDKIVTDIVESEASGFSHGFWIFG